MDTNGYMRYIEAVADRGILAAIRLACDDGRRVLYDRDVVPAQLIPCDPVDATHVAMIVDEIVVVGPIKGRPTNHGSKGKPDWEFVMQAFVVAPRKGWVVVPWRQSKCYGLPVFARHKGN